MNERRFTDEEVRAILKKAVEKASSSTAVARREGLSMAELKVIGAEVGIDPESLEDAARAVAMRGRRQPSGRLLGGPTVLDCERTVGRAITPEDTPEVLSVIRRTMGTQGEVDEIHGSLEWHTKGDGGESYVTLAPKGDTTTIRSSANLTNAATLTYLPVGIMGVIGSLVGVTQYFKDGTTGALIFALVFLPILYGILRTVYGAYASRQEAKVELVADELVRLLESE